jgi:hypothetical protein
MSDGNNIEVRMPDDMQAGVFANNMVISHTKEEFVLDFMMVAPPTGTVTARVIVTPGHMKRILAAFKENVARYEKAHGKIEAGPAPKQKLGFQPE